MNRRAYEEHHVRYTQAAKGRVAVVEIIKICVVIFLTGCILLAMETTAPGKIHLPFLPIPAAAPSLGILFVMAVGFLFDEKAGGITGLFVGWLADATGGDVIILLPLFYFLCGYLSGAVGKRKLARNLPSFLIFTLVGSAAEFAYSVGKIAVTHSLPPVTFLTHNVLPTALLTLIWSPVVYGIVYVERKILKR